MLIHNTDDIILIKLGEKDVIATVDALEVCVPENGENTFTKIPEPSN